MRDYLHHILAGRPWWMNPLMLFCAFMTFVYLPWDIFWKPVAVDQEVWFGIQFEGWAAKLTAPFHWFVYGAGYYGFRRMRSWMWPWAAVYTAQIALGMLVWNWITTGGLLGWFVGIIGATPFAGLTFLLWNARSHFQREERSLRERYGEWALVTGASAGIGEAFARALARDGVSVVLTARRRERLETLAAALEKDFQVATRIVVADLGEPGGVEAVIEQVRDLSISILVANAGAGYAGRFEKLEPERLRRMVELNCTAPMLLTRALLPGMCEQFCGAVILSGSVAGRQPLPFHGVYSATKAFDLFLGESLWAEMQGTGVDVVVLEPGRTETEFQAAAGEIPHAGESAEKVVANALQALGRQPSVVSGWGNWLLANLGPRLGPRPFALHAARDVVLRQTPQDMR
ncbi:MAG: SDR family oxidoreductase [Proteobacteria bacterium]|nr:SDR family oxidoreductase [Pseudomonadota bacterium]